MAKLPDESVTPLTAADVIRVLDLKPHPEGGHFRQTFRDSKTVDGARAASTAIYFLLARGERSHWHRVDAVEIWHWHAGAPLALEIAAKLQGWNRFDAAEAWHWHAGAPLELEIASASGHRERLTLGSDLAAGQRPQAVVPADAWQAAQSLGDWTLVGCTVAPGFEFAKFELAPKDWEPGS